MKSIKYSTENLYGKTQKISIFVRKNNLVSTFPLTTTNIISRHRLEAESIVENFILVESRL